MVNPICPGCGAELPSGQAALCERCGAKVIPLPPGAGEASDRWVVWLAVLAVVLFFGTILLSALLAAFVFGMSAGVERTKTVAATAKQARDDIYVTWQGGMDNGLVSSYRVMVHDTRVPGDLPPIVGNTTRVGGGTPGQDHVVVMATFTDGSEQVVLDTFV